MRRLTFLFTFCFLARAVSLAQPAFFEEVIGDTTIGENASAVVQLPSGSIFMMGHADLDSIGDYDLSLTKLDANGNLIWHRYFGTTDPDFCTFGMLTSDGDLLFGGESFSTFTTALVVKVDTNGNEIWQHQVQSPTYTISYTRACEGPDSSYYLSGFQKDTSITAWGNNIYVEKLSYTGNTIWQIEFGDSLNDYGQSITATPDSNVVVLSDRLKPDGSYGVILTKIDSAGNILWNLDVNTPYNAGGQDIHVLSDGNYLAIGESGTATAAPFDVYLVKADPQGNLLWINWVDGTNEAEAGFDFVEDPTTGDLFITGYGYSTSLAENQLIFWHTDSTGNVIGKSFYGNAGGIDIGYDIVESPLGGYIICGETNPHSKQYYLLHDSIPFPVFATVGTQVEHIDLAVYPNPLQSGDQILRFNRAVPQSHLKLFDMEGRLYYETTLPEHTEALVLPVGLPAGTYLLDIQSQRLRVTQRIVIF